MYLKMTVNINSLSSTSNSLAASRTSPAVSWKEIYETKIYRCSQVGVGEVSYQPFSLSLVTSICLSHTKSYNYFFAMQAQLYIVINAWPTVARSHTIVFQTNASRPHFHVAVEMNAEQ